MKYLFTSFFILFFSLSYSQNNKLTNSFKFKNGLYKTYEEFKNNQPSISWDNVQSDVVVMEIIHKAKMSQLKQGDSLLFIDDFWGFSINNIPYKKSTFNTKTNSFTFSGIQLRGNICYYEYKIEKEKPVKVSAYNPKTGKPFRTSTIIKKEIITKKIMLQFLSGKEIDYTLENVEKWISSDEKLLKTFQETKVKELSKKLFKFVQIFNDRNPIQI